MPGFTMDFSSMRQGVAERVLNRHRQHALAEEMHVQWEKRELQELMRPARKPSMPQRDPDPDPDPSADPDPARPASRRGGPRRSSVYDRERTATRRQSMADLPRQSLISSRQYSEEINYSSRVPKTRVLLARRRQSEPASQDQGILGEMRAVLNEADKLSRMRMRPEEEWQRVLDRTLPGRGGPTRGRGDNSSGDQGSERRARPLGPRKEVNLIVSGGKAAEEADIGADWPSQPRPAPTPRPSQLSSHAPSNAPSNASSHAPSNAPSQTPSNTPGNTPSDTTSSSRRLSRDAAVSHMSQALPTHRSPTRRGKRDDDENQELGEDNSQRRQTTSGGEESLPGGDEDQSNPLRLDLQGCGRDTPRSDSPNSHRAEASDGENDSDGEDNESINAGNMNEGMPPRADRAREEEQVMDSKEWEELKKCRYLRGYNPPELSIPAVDYREFVFPKDDGM